MLITSANRGVGFTARDGRRNSVRAGVVKIPVNWKDVRSLAGSEGNISACRVQVVDGTTSQGPR